MKGTKMWANYKMLEVIPQKNSTRSHLRINGDDVFIIADTARFYVRDQLRYNSLC